MNIVATRWFNLALALVVTASYASQKLAAQNPVYDSRKKLVLLLADGHADSGNAALPDFAAKHLAGEFRTIIVRGSMADNEHSFDRLEEIVDANVLVVSVTRRAPPKRQLDLLRRYVAAGGPIVGIRTASHSFAISKGQNFPEGGAAWPEWDNEVIGGTYTGLVRGNPIVNTPTGRHQDVIVRNLELPYSANSALYKMSPLCTGAKPLLIGVVAGLPPEPVAWTFIRKDGGRTFYTSLGVAGDFKNVGFEQFLRDGILWAAGIFPP